MYAENQYLEVDLIENINYTNFKFPLMIIDFLIFVDYFYPFFRSQNYTVEVNIFILKFHSLYC
jgi:hypothetical protein